MSTEHDDQASAEPPVESKDDPRKQSKILYTREFLLSLSELDVCKNLPSDFDASLLSEFEDASCIVDRQRGTGGLSLLNSKRGDYGSLPPNRLDNAISYNHGSSGRWDTRSSGSSDRDGDLQPDRESFNQDAGRRFGNQPRRSWQQPEHDGLLGSGSFPRPPGFPGGSTSKTKGNGYYQLNRSSEPYQPPRPYKAAPYSRKESADFVDDETFGSAEFASEDRAEEERKRRASFELMRKEQHKVLQEKQKQMPSNQKATNTVDIIALLESSEDPKTIANIKEQNDTVGTSQSESTRSMKAQGPSSRPLVPPGFASALVEKNFRLQSSSNVHSSSEAQTATVEDKNSLYSTSNDQEMRSHSAAGIQAVNHLVHSASVPCEPHRLHEAHDVLVDEFIKISPEKDAQSGFMGEIKQDQSATILAKLFGNASPKDYGGSPNSVERQEKIRNKETWNLTASESSKFAQWFLEEEKKPVENISMDLLSLIVSSDNIGSETAVVSDHGTSEHISPNLYLEENNPAQNSLEFPETASIPGISQPCQVEKLNSSPVVLTCEDLEQSILAEVKDGSSNMQHLRQESGTVVGAKLGGQKGNVDNHASQHLLSLLQKGTLLKDSMSPMKVGITVADDSVADSDAKAGLNFNVVDSAGFRNSETVQSSEKTLTLEALFGAAFMNELHSADAPLSVQRVSAGHTNSIDIGQSLSLPFLGKNDKFFSSDSGEYQSGRSCRGGNEEASLHNVQEANAHNVPGPWVGYKNSSFEGSKLNDVGVREGPGDIHLPEEDSLIIVGDSVNPTSESSVPRNDIEDLLQKLTPAERNDKLLMAFLTDGARKERPGLGGIGPFHVPSDVVSFDDPFRRLNERPSSQPHLMNQMRPVMPHLDHHNSQIPQMRFFGPEGIHHDPYQQLPANVLPTNAFPGPGGPRLIPASPHPMLQHFPIPGSLQQHALQGFPRGVPFSHPLNHLPGYMTEMSNIHGYPLNHRQPNYSAVGMGMPGSNPRGGNSEAFERLEMEGRANLNHIHPSASGRPPAAYGPELPMGFGYR